jgi:predicted Zn-dependent protease
MSFDQLKQAARDLTDARRNQGFDTLKASAVTSSRIGIRIAQSTVCRENVFNESSYLNVHGAWQGRESEFSVSGRDRDDAPRLTGTMLANLRSQSENKEYCPPEIGRGSFSWDVAKERFDDVYSPEILYPVIEHWAAKVRAHGLRLTGYIECEETKAHSWYASYCSDTAMDLSTHDHGMSFSVTVDNEKSGAVGTTQRAAVKISRTQFDQLFGEAVEEALNTALTSEQPGEIAPGDYTVILHPACVNDIVLTAMMYGMFDQRKIDEGRTYLAKARGQLRFPAGMFLHQDLAVDRRGLVYRDCPFNRDGVECDSIRLIDNGRVEGTHVSRFWAGKSDRRETFSAWDGPPMVCGATAHSTLHGKYQSLRDLIAGTEHGIFVCNTWYLRMVAEMEGIITGMTRDGLFEIREGKITRPLKNMRWHDNPFRILSAVNALTDEGITFGRSRLAGRSRLPLTWMPAARVENFHFSSATKF